MFEKGSVALELAASSLVCCHITTFRMSQLTSMVSVSCSDPRVIPEQYFGLNRGEAAIVRNAGGRASDALRSIATLDAIGGLSTIIVVHHTGKYRSRRMKTITIYLLQFQLTRAQIAVPPLYLMRRYETC